MNVPVCQDVVVLNVLFVMTCADVYFDVFCLVAKTIVVLYDLRT